MYGGSFYAVCDAWEFDDDLIRHFRVIRRAQCMNSPFAMNHIPLPSLIMPWLNQKRPGASKHLKMSSTKMGPFCPGGDEFRNICLSPYPPYWYHYLSPFALCRHYMETWGIPGSMANSHSKWLVTQALISSFTVTKQTFELPVIWEAVLLVTSLWLRNRCWPIIHWILWPLIYKPRQYYFHNFGYNVTNITHFPKDMKIKVTTFPSGITIHEGLIAK